MPAHNDLTLFRLIILFEILMCLYGVYLFGVYILYGHFKARWNSGAVERVSYSGTGSRRWLMQTPNSPADLQPNAVDQVAPAKQPHTLIGPR